MVIGKPHLRLGEFMVFCLLFCSRHMILAGRSVGFLT